MSRPALLWGPPILICNGYGSLSPGVKEPQHKADYSSPSSTNIKNEYSNTSTPQLPSWHDKDNFTFTLSAVMYGYSKNVFEKSGKENLELRGYM